VKDIKKFSLSDNGLTDNGLTDNGDGNGNTASNNENNGNNGNNVNNSNPSVAINYERMKIFGMFLLIILVDQLIEGNDRVPSILGITKYYKFK